jgi:hypothetical protein
VGEAFYGDECWWCLECAVAVGVEIADMIDRGCLVHGTGVGGFEPLEKSPSVDNFSCC